MSAESGYKTLRDREFMLVLATLKPRLKRAGMELDLDFAFDGASTSCRHVPVTVAITNGIATFVLEVSEPRRAYVITEFCVARDRHSEVVTRQMPDFAAAAEVSELLRLLTEVGAWVRMDCRKWKPK